MQVVYVLRFFYRRLGISAVIVQIYTPISGADISSYVEEGDGLILTVLIINFSLFKNFIFFYMHGYYLD
jgi:hypothetical protein